MATGHWNVGIADVDTGKWHLITNDAFGNLESNFHPNGKRIIFSSHRSQSQKLWSMDIDGSHLARLTEGDMEDTAGKYSRDGRLIVYASYQRWKYEVWILDLATGKRWPLTKLSRLDTGEPHFINGERAVVCSTREGLIPCVGRVNLDGTDFTMLTRGPIENSWTATR
jgi:TolB protein